MVSLLISFKILLPVIIPMLTDLFNHVFVISTNPNSWKRALVVPISKISKLLLLDLLVFFLFFLKHSIFHFMNKSLNIWMTICGFQRGSRKGYNSTTALLKISTFPRPRIKVVLQYYFF